MGSTRLKTFRFNSGGRRNPPDQDYVEKEICFYIREHGRQQRRRVRVVRRNRRSSFDPTVSRRRPRTRRRSGIHGNRAGVVAIFTPTESAHLAILAGVDIDELPEQIRYWKKDEPYVGNSILDRLDPEDWVLKDYFRELSFHITFTISKTFMNNLRKDFGFPRVDWSAIAEKGGLYS